MLAVKISSEFCHHFLLHVLCDFQTITLKTVEETQTLLCHMYKTYFLSKSRVCNSTNNNSIRVL